MIYPQQQSQHVDAQLIQGAVGFLMTALFGIWVIQQGIKVIRGEEVERPF
jgi:hypothetical protein